VFTAVVLIVDNEVGLKGRVLMTYRGSPDQARFDSSNEIGNPEITQHVSVPEDMDIHFIRGSIDEDENIILSEDIDAKLSNPRNTKLNEVRAIREAKLHKLDVLCNIAYLNSWSALEKTELKNYRQDLLDITEVYKDNMASLDDLDISTIEWPTEPTES
jgi:hypothetical protein